MKTFIPALSMVAVMLTPMRSAAQAGTVPLTLPRFDTSASLGWYSANEPLAASHESWYGHSLNRSIAAGYYWTEHVKTEVEVGWTGTGELYAEHPDSAPSLQIYGWVQHFYSTTNLVLAQRYQFGHNALFHPNVAAGAMLEWVNHSAEFGPLYGRSGTMIQPPRTVPPTTERRSSAFVSSGFKAYANERLFLRSDLRVGFTRDVMHILLNAGIGIDF